MKKITKREIDNVIIYSLFDFRGYTDNEETALKRIIEDYTEKGIEFALSKYAENVFKRI